MSQYRYVLAALALVAADVGSAAADDGRLFLQHGGKNAAFSALSGRPGFWPNRLQVEQSGGPQRAGAVQRGASDYVGLAQQGRGDAATITQAGDHNSATIRQFGRNDTAAITQTGANNAACVVQFGTGAVADVTQSGGESLGIVQGPMGTSAVRMKLCTHLAARGSIFGRTWR